MSQQYYDDIDEDLHRFCDDMETELKAISDSISKPEKIASISSGKSDKGSIASDSLADKKSKETTTVAASPWGISIFSSFASSATKSLSASFSPLAKDLSSISSFATSATKAFSDTFNSTLYTSSVENCGQSDDLTGLATDPASLEKLKRIQAEHNAKRSEMEYACLIASKSSRETVVPARSVTQIPYTVPPGKEVTWKFKVKHYDILFGVKLRVQEDDGSGEWTEHELLPLERITSEDYVNESCYSETCARKFIFILDNSIAMLYAKTVAFDIVMNDDPDWQEQVEQNQGTYESFNKPFEDSNHNVSEQEDLGPVCDDNDLEVCDNHDSHVFEEQIEHIEEWTMHYSDDGHPFYYNNYTNESQWEKPEVFMNNSDDVAPNEEDDEEASMAMLMQKISSGCKNGHLTPEQREKFMTDIIDCRDLSEIHKDLNQILEDNCELKPQCNSVTEE